MIDTELLQKIVKAAEAVPERYREALFTFLLSRTENEEKDTSTRLPVHIPSISSGSVDYARLFSGSNRGDTRLLAAIAILEQGNGDNGALLSELPELYKRNRIKPPGNIPRDITALIRKQLLLELSREGRSVRVGLTQGGRTVLEQAASSES